MPAIVSKASTPEYRHNYDLIFGKNKVVEHFDKKEMQMLSDKFNSVKDVELEVIPLESKGVADESMLN